MNLPSISFSYRLGLAFHALNNEGSDGSNLMQPRRIDVGKQVYDGISGEIIRRHILENFVRICREQKIPMLPLSEGLHPDRGLIGIRASAKSDGQDSLDNTNLLKAFRKAIGDCAVLDVGGFLAPFAESSKDKFVIEGEYINNNCADIKQGNVPEPVKRETCFDVAWLISESPQDLTITQHSAFRDTASANSRYAQTMRSNIYGGVIRADLHRIGTDDYWYLQTGKERLIITPDDQSKRQYALIQAIIDYLAAPTGAKLAGWAPHVFQTEGAILVTKNRTAPFVSPISVKLSDSQNPVQFNAEYQEKMKSLGGGDNSNAMSFSFTDVKQLLEKYSEIENFLKNGETKYSST